MRKVSMYAKNDKVHFCTSTKKPCANLHKSFFSYSTFEPYSAFNYSAEGEVCALAGTLR